VCLFNNIVKQLNVFVKEFFVELIPSNSIKYANEGNRLNKNEGKDRGFFVYPPKLYIPGDITSIENG